MYEVHEATPLLAYGTARADIRMDMLVRMCIALARAQEAATVILQIISRKHAILLKITRLRRGQAAPYCTPRPLFLRTCAHPRPRDTRSFRYTRRSCERREGCPRKSPTDESYCTF